MVEKDYNHLSGQKISRIEALSDGIFAITMTLLVLDLKIPSSDGVRSEAEILSAIYALSPKLLSYLLGFMTLGIFWLGHSAQFKFIVRADRHLTWLTIFFLMFISLLPFSTAFLSEHINFKLAIGVYWLNIFLAGMALLIHWNYACREGLIGEQVDQTTIYQAIRNRIIYAQALYATAAAFSFVNNYLSITLMILIQLTYALALSLKAEKRSEQ